jgi:tryptophan-rich sensory protein/uncharacterized protein YbjT (DUF2867 family)
LLGRLRSRSVSIRCLARRPEFLDVPRDRVEVVGGDVLDLESLRVALAGIDVAYYLVHSMGSAGDFESEDRLGAGNFAAAAAAAGVGRIVYLGGLSQETDRLSPHLRSRQEVGRILHSTGVPVVELRASIVLGSGSVSFEMIRALVEKLPVMITPRWLDVPAQPIAIDDLLGYLVAALDLPAAESRVYEIGGADRVSYGDLIREYARQRGLRRLLIPVPVLTPRLSSLWLGLVTPVYARIGRKLIDSMRHSTVVRDNSALADFDIRPMGYRASIAAALRKEDREAAETRWSDAVSSSGALSTWAGVRFGNRRAESRSAHTPAPPEAAFVPIRRIGGEQGWHCASGLWKLRGAIDVLFGGVGLRRGRRHADNLRVGDTIDCWRVEAFDPDRRLRLFAEMRLPGRAWLEFEVEPAHGGSTVRQTAVFDPIGLSGLAYWYLVWPLHQLVFAGMLRGIIEAGRRLPGPSRPGLRTSPVRQMVGLAVILAICLGAGRLGGALTATSVGGWYQDLVKPAWSPRDEVFRPVWTVLYLMMAMAAWLVWRRDGWSGARPALALFGVQLVLNVGWSAIFFGLRSPGLALVEIVVLVVAVAATAVAFLGRSTAAALMMLPYLAWALFAAALNSSVWRLNS